MLVIPLLQGSAEFVCAMEDVHEVGQRQYADNDFAAWSSGSWIPSRLARVRPAWGGGAPRLRQLGVELFMVRHAGWRRI